MMKKLLVIVFYLLSFNVYAAEHIFTFDNQQDKQRFQQLTKELRCVVCPNQSLAESNASLAQDLRREIYLQVGEGRSNREIKQFLMDRYGEFILYKPPVDFKTLLLWLGPFLMLLLGLFSLKNKYKFTIAQ